MLPADLADCESAQIPSDKTKVEIVKVEDPKLEIEIVERENKVEILGRQNIGFRKPGAASGRGNLVPKLVRFLVWIWGSRSGNGGNAKAQKFISLYFCNLEIDVCKEESAENPIETPHAPGLWLFCAGLSCLAFPFA